MSLKEYGDLSEMQLDALCEIGNIGSGNAATALSSMLERPVNIKVPRIRVLDYETVSENLGGPETLMVGLLLTLGGDLHGMIMFLMRQEFAHMLLNDLVGTSFDPSEGLDDMAGSAIAEVGNIMAASYLNAIASLTGLTIEMSVPSLAVDMVGAILSVPSIHYANISDKIIFIEDEFDQGNAHNASHVLLIPDVESLQKIITSLGLDE